MGQIPGLTKGLTYELVGRRAVEVGIIKTTGVPILLRSDATYVGSAFYDVGGAIRSLVLFDSRRFVIAPSVREDVDLISQYYLLIDPMRRWKAIRTAVEDAIDDLSELYGQIDLDDDAGCAALDERLDVFRAAALFWYLGMYNLYADTRHADKILELAMDMSDQTSIEILAKQDVPPGVAV